MSWFNNVSTMVKVGIGFALLIAMLVGVGLLGLSTGSIANAAADVTFNRDLPGIVLAEDAAEDIMLAARAYRNPMILRTAKSREEGLRSLDEIETTHRAHLATLEASLVLEENRQRMVEIKKQSAEFFGMAREAVRLSEADMDKAIEMMGRSAPTGNAVRASLNEVSRIKQALAKKGHEESASQYTQSRNLVFGAIALALAVGIAASLLVGRSIAGPLHNAVSVLQRVARGDLTARLTLDRKDEVGIMAVALNESLESVMKTLGSVQEVSIEVSAASAQLAATAQQISSGAQEQAASLEETAASLEEISSTVKQNSDNAQHASQLASGARDSAERGGKVVESAVSAMTEITRSSKRIADIITTIDEIAFQTNLLALNAAVEAARAGEQGRGFGVVAAEVRSLAQRTATAAKEIRGLIAESTNRVEVGTMQVNESGKTLDEIVKSVKRVTDMVADIAAASREQNTGLEQVNTAVTQVDQVTQLNAAQTEELSATASSLSEKSAQLQELVSAFALGNGSTRAAAAPAREPPRVVARPVTRKATLAPNRAAVRRPEARDAAKLVALNGSAAPPALKAANGYEEF